MDDAMKERIQDKLDLFEKQFGQFIQHENNLKLGPGKPNWAIGINNAKQIGRMGEIVATNPRWTAICFKEETAIFRSEDIDNIKP